VAELERELENREELISEYEKKLLDNSRFISYLEGKLQSFEEKESTAADDIDK
jgi:hypothetical protein